MGDDNKQQTQTSRKRTIGQIIPKPNPGRTRGGKEPTGRAVARPQPNPDGTMPTAGQELLDDQLSGLQTDFFNRYNATAERQLADYDRMMGNYGDWRNKMIMPLIDDINSRQPHQFTFERINPTRSEDTQFAMTGYRDFATTGGYSPEDITDLRARGVSPIRAAYGNAMTEVDRQAALAGGGGYAPNKIAAIASMQRLLPQQLADATQNVNAQLAEAIRSGRLAGLAGVTGISEAEAGRMMQAALANQGADIQTQGMTEDAYNAWLGQRMNAQNLYGSSLDAERSLYGTTPALAATFGNQALAAMGLQAQIEQQRIAAANAARGLDINQQQVDQSKTPWWQTALKYGLGALPFIGQLVGRNNSGNNLPQGGSGTINPDLSGVGSGGPIFSESGPRIGFGNGGVNVNFGNIPGGPPSSRGTGGFRQPAPPPPGTPVAEGTIVTIGEAMAQRLGLPGPGQYRVMGQWPNQRYVKV